MFFQKGSKDTPLLLFLHFLTQPPTKKKNNKERRGIMKYVYVYVSILKELNINDV